jgi:hypothetical protein
MLKLGTKCMRFKNIYSRDTHSNNSDSDWLKAIRKKKRQNEKKKVIKFGINLSFSLPLNPVYSFR